MARPVSSAIARRILLAPSPVLEVASEPARVRHAQFRSKRIEARTGSIMVRARRRSVASRLSLSRRSVVAFNSPYPQDLHAEQLFLCTHSYCGTIGKVFFCTEMIGVLKCLYLR